MDSLGVKTQCLFMYQLHREDSTYANDVMVYVCCDGGSIKAKQSGCGKEGVKQQGLVV